MLGYSIADIWKQYSKSLWNGRRIFISNQILLAEGGNQRLGHKTNYQITNDVDGSHFISVYKMADADNGCSMYDTGGSIEGFV